MPASKYINDNYGHDAGDSLLIRIADALKSTDFSEESYRAAGDEFLVQGQTEEDIVRAIEKAYSYLEQNPIQVRKDNKTITISAGFSYGTAETLEKAEEKLRVHKAEREARGERARRGKKPPGILGPIPERIGVEDRGEGIPEAEVKPAGPKPRPKLKPEPKIELKPKPKPKPEPGPVKSLAKIPHVKGDTAKTYLGDNTGVDIQYVAVDIDDLIYRENSHTY